MHPGQKGCFCAACLTIAIVCKCVRLQGKYKPLIDSPEDYSNKMHFDIGRSFFDFSCNLVKIQKHLPLVIHERLSNVLAAHKLH